MLLSSLMQTKGLFASVIVFCTLVAGSEPTLPAQETTVSHAHDGEIASLLDGTKTHNDLIERVIQTGDWRLLRFIMGRAGLRGAWDQDRVQALARTMAERDEQIIRLSLSRAGMIWDSVSEMDRRRQEWQHLEGLQQAYEWRYQHIQLLGCEQNQTILGLLQQAIPLVLDLHTRTFPFPQESERPIHIQIYPTRSLYDAQDFRAGSWATYRPSRNKIAIWIDREALNEDENKEIVRLIQALAHEMWHAYIQYHAPGMPVWMEEGIAEVFESALVRGNRRLSIGPEIINATNLTVVSHHRRGNRCIPVDELMLFTNAQFAARAQVAYPQSWSLMHSMMFAEDKEIADIPHRVIANLRQGLFAEKAVETALGNLTWDRIEQHWHQDLKRQQQAPKRPREYPPTVKDSPTD